MDEITPEDLQEKRENIASLREQIAEAQQEAANNALQAERMIDYALLQAEETALERQLELAQAAAKTEVAAENASGPLEAALETLAVAENNDQTPPGVTVDPNEGVEADADEKSGE